MSRIVCGRFDRTLDADAALEALKREGFPRNEVDAFYVGPPGQNARAPIGGDVHSDAGARQAGVAAGIGAAIGLAVGLIVGVLIWNEEQIRGGTDPDAAEAELEAADEVEAFVKDSALVE